MHNKKIFENYDNINIILNKYDTKYHINYLLLFTLT